MLLTEDEAREKECRAGGAYFDFEQEADTAIRRVLAWPQCSASDCMAWDWFDPPEERRAAEPDNLDGWTVHKMPVVLGSGELADISFEWIRLNPARRGSCGLAGKMEE